MAFPSPAPPVPSAHGHPTTTSPKRARVSEKKRKRARELEQELLFLQARFRFYSEPDLVELLQRAINDAHRLGESTRQSDRDSVLQVLERYEAAEIDDLEDETNLSRWVVDQILSEFEDKKLIGKRPVRDPAGSVGGRPRWVYFLLHSKP